MLEQWPPRFLEHFYAERVRLGALKCSSIQGARSHLMASTNLHGYEPAPIQAPMNFIRLYARVLKLLGDESRLGWMLAIANVSLAAAQFAEPVLFGRIVDTLAGAQSRGGVPVWTDLVTLLAAWVSFGLFTITCGTLVALHADRLAHRRRHAVMTNYFEHILQLPLSFHGGIHSGRLMKVMLTGTDSLWWLWLGFFREHLAAFRSGPISSPSWQRG